MLEDLQQSVSRPGSSLGHNSASNFSTMSSNRDVQYYTSPNASTKIVRERSVSPTSGRRTYKTSKYEYSSSNGGNALLPSNGTDSGYNTSSKVNVETSINQLDSLLDELKVERDLANEPSESERLISLQQSVIEEEEEDDDDVAAAVAAVAKTQTGVFKSQVKIPHTNDSTGLFLTPSGVCILMSASSSSHYYYYSPLANYTLGHRFRTIVSAEQIPDCNDKCED